MIWDKEKAYEEGFVNGIWAVLLYFEEHKMYRRLEYPPSYGGNMTELASQIHDDMNHLSYKNWRKNEGGQMKLEEDKDETV